MSNPPDAPLRHEQREEPLFVFTLGCVLIGVAVAAGLALAAALL